MSTDYGLCCECGGLWITDNIREQDALDILSDIHHLAKLHEAMLELRTDIYLTSFFSSSNDQAGLLEFAFKHHDHKLQVINEYLLFELEE